jgi:3,4-dihydroxy 2-butanone 4-phosphate synthase/GTP cyclohydrolase II
VFASLHCDCNHQLESALDQIAAEGRGVLVYLEQEGRGIGIRAKALAYELQRSGLDTFEANEKLGLPRDARHYGFAAHILRYLGVRRLRLLTTNPDKVATLLHEGIEVVTQIPLTGGGNPVNFRYLISKVASGHNAALLL